jgi:hypothetical protein
MRYFRVSTISGLEAAYLIERDNTLGGRTAVVSYGGIWYDVRRLSSRELEDFIDDLARRTLRVAFAPN